MMRECESPDHPVDRAHKDVQRVLLRFGGWGNSHRGYGSTPRWYCAKCRLRDLGRWKFYSKAQVRELRKEAAKAVKEPT